MVQNLTLCGLLTWPTCPIWQNLIDLYFGRESIDPENLCQIRPQLFCFAARPQTRQ